MRTIKPWDKFLFENEGAPEITKQPIYFWGVADGDEFTGEMDFYLTPIENEIPPREILVN